MLNDAGEAGDAVGLKSDRTDKRPRVKCGLNSTQLNEHLWTQVLKHLNVHIYVGTISYRYYNQLISRTDLSPIPVTLKVSPTHRPPTGPPAEPAAGRWVHPPTGRWFGVQTDDGR